MATVDVELDNILEEIGQFGRYQRRSYLLISLIFIFSAIYNTNYIFTADDDTYRCMIPECDGDNTSLEAEWLHIAMPSSTDPRRCSRYASTNTTLERDTCSPDIFNTSEVVTCEKWLFGGGNTIVKELGIQCQGWKRTLVGTVHSVGLLVALPIVASISDRYGRRVALVSSAVLAGIFGLARSFSTNYIMFMVFEFLEPALGSGVYSSGFILGMELVGPKRRVLGATILTMFYSSGEILLGALAWVLPYWRHLLRVIYAPSLLFFVYFWMIHESVRWLISNGQYHKAVAILKDAAATNGVTLSDKSMESLYLNVESSQNEIKTDIEGNPEKKRSIYAEVMKSRVILTRLITCSFWWITCTFVYYGLSINAVSLTGNVYLNFMLVASVELPAYLTGFCVLDRYGRKYTLFCAFFASGVACIAFPLLPTDQNWILLVTYLLGKFFITLAFGSLYVYTSELFPTLLRHSLLGTCSMIGRIGSIIAPQTPLLAEYVPGLPSYLFGSMSILSSILMLTSPETLNIKLPDTIEEAENIMKSKINIAS